MYSELHEIEQPKLGEMPIQFFDDVPLYGIPKKALYKVYHDGSHYVANLQEGSCRKRCDLHKHKYTEIDRYFDEELCRALNDNYKGIVLQNHLVRQVSAQFPQVRSATEYVSKMIHRRWLNLHNRKKRFSRKAYLNKWNYFVTVTYDDNKHSEESFRRKLRKTLSNFHSRRGWLYMGVFERAPETDRLHFHALVYVPNGEMVGNIFARKDYSTAQHKMQETACNTFFENKFGRNDFEELDEMEIRKGNTIEYLLKYIGKSNERIVYSRGIKTEICIELTQDKIACEDIDKPKRYVLFDNAINWVKDIMRKRFGLLDYATHGSKDVMRIKYKQQSFLTA